MPRHSTKSSVSEEPPVRQRPPVCSAALTPDQVSPGASAIDPEEWAFGLRHLQGHQRIVR